MSEDNNTGEQTSRTEFEENVTSNVDDGGGCTEAWEKLSEMRSEGGTNKIRRNLMKTVATAAVGFGFVSGSGSAEKSTRDNLKEDLSGISYVGVTDPQERAEIKSQAFSSDDVKRLSREFAQNGWSPQRDNLLINKTVSEDAEVIQYTVAIPHRADNGDASIIWTDNENLEVKGLRRTGQIGTGQTFETYTVENGTVVSTTDTITESEIEDAPRADADNISIQGTGSFPNCTWNTSCVGSFAAGLAGIIGCCSTCSSGIGAVATAGASCVCCVLSGIAFVSVDCNLCR